MCRSWCHDGSRQSINVSTGSSVGEGDTNVWESWLEVQTLVNISECSWMSFKMFVWTLMVFFVFYKNVG